MAEFAKGTVVRLKSGGPLMFVQRPYQSLDGCGPNHGEGDYWCRWIDRDGHAQANFWPGDALVESTDEPGPGGLFDTPEIRAYDELYDRALGELGPLPPARQLQIVMSWMGADNMQAMVDCLTKG